LEPFIAQLAVAKVTNGSAFVTGQLFDGYLPHLSFFFNQSASAISNTVVYEVFNGSVPVDQRGVEALRRDLLSLMALIG
jgi:subfamily B ATP-binding cassette protein MsbA